MNSLFSFASFQLYYTLTYHHHHFLASALNFTAFLPLSICARDTFFPAIWVHITSFCISTFVFQGRDHSGWTVHYRMHLLKLSFLRLSCLMGNLNISAAAAAAAKLFSASLDSHWTVYIYTATSEWLKSGWAELFLASFDCLYTLQPQGDLNPAELPKEWLERSCTPIR